MSKRLEAIYRDDQRSKDYRYGYRNALRAAADFLESWEGHVLAHRLGDLLLCKFNQTKRKPRLRKKVPR